MKRQLDRLIADYKAILPLKEEYRKELDKKFRLEFNFNSNHLEGNTLTYGETKLLLLFDQTKGTHEMREYEEMKAHDVALKMIKDEASNKEKPLTEQFIKELNEIILVRPFWKDAETKEGVGTRRIIKVGEYKELPNSVRLPNGEMFEYAPPQDVPILMADLVGWYNDEIEKGELTAIELASLLHYRFIRIHPFDDGNGRVARLLVNYVLYGNDLPPVIIKSSEKRDYLRALQQADAYDLKVFIDYMMQQLAWSLDLTIRASKGESIEEQDDWEKQLALLKRGLGDKSDEVVKKSEESVTKLYFNVIIPLSDMIIEKLSKYDILFMNSSHFIYSNLSWKQIEVDKQTQLGPIIFEDSDYSASDFLLFSNIFSQLRNPILDFKLSGSIYLTFQDNVYVIKWLDKQISKLYSHFLTHDEMNQIISDIAKDLMQKIDKAINEN